VTLKTAAGNLARLDPGFRRDDERYGGTKRPINDKKNIVIPAKAGIHLRLPPTQR
jgi:hypothetical protein